MNDDDAIVAAAGLCDRLPWLGAPRGRIEYKDQTGTLYVYKYQGGWLWSYFDLHGWEPYAVSPRPCPSRRAALARARLVLGREIQGTDNATPVVATSTNKHGWRPGTKKGRRKPDLKLVVWK